MPADVLMPFLVLSGFLVLAGLMVALAVRRSRRGFAWEERGEWSDEQS